MKTLKKVFDLADETSATILKKVFDLENNKDNRELDLHDEAVLSLFEDMLGKVSSMIVLISSQKHNGLDSFTRMLFENYAYIKYILERNTEDRGKAYIYSQKLEDIKVFDILTGMTESGSAARQRIGISRDKILKDLPMLSDHDYRERVKNKYVNELRLGKTNRKWYDYNGKTGNFRKLCEHLNLLDYYVLIYKILSREVHAGEPTKYFKISREEVSVLRKQTNLLMHINVSSLFLIEIVRDIYKYYGLHDELRNFNAIVAINHLLK
ncbi:MAG: hypothetical protein K0Q56_2095 [Sporolactobacillus laevolacticus]|nr:hypothetical protein [Sporolactobacillus laevolacticus]